MTTTTQAKLVRLKPIPGYIITDAVGSIELDGEYVADFCEVDPGWFYTAGPDGSEVFTGTEAEVVEHYSAKGAPAVTKETP